MDKANTKLFQESVKATADFIVKKIDRTLKESSEHNRLGVQIEIIRQLTVKIMEDETIGKENLS